MLKGIIIAGLSSGIEGGSAFILLSEIVISLIAILLLKTALIILIPFRLTVSMLPLI